MDLVLPTVLALVIGPFMIGWWVGNPVMAASVFLALSVTVLLGAGWRDGAEDAAVGLAVALAVSAVSSAAGGHLAARRRPRRPPG